MTQRSRRTLALLTGTALVAGLLGATAGVATAKPETTDQSWRSLLPDYTPGNLRVTDTTSTTASLAWDRPTGATRFRVVWADNAEMTDRQHRRTRHDHVTIRDLAPGTTYWLRVRVSQLYGLHWRGPASTPVEVTTDGSSTPPPRPGDTLFGANYSTLSSVDESVYDGRAEAARIFFQQLDGVQFSRNASVQQAMGDGVRTFVVSWKETDLAAIRTFLAGIPDGVTVYTSFNHEPEDDRGAPGSDGYRAWSAEYKRQWSLQSPVMRAAGAIPTNILMAWTLQPGSGRQVADWTPPRGTVDVFAFDAYYGKGKDPAALVDRMAAAAEAAGVPQSGLAETGASTSEPDRLAKTRAMRAALLDSGSFAWALYWNSAGSTGFDSRMDAATADAWFG